MLTAIPAAALAELVGVLPGPGRIGVDARLAGWFRRLMAAHPDDPSELGYVVDDPLTYGGITLWEADGVPVAMAGRNRTVAGMVRLGAVYAPDDDAYGAAAFAAASGTARRTARDVLVFAGASGGAAAAYRDLGFRPVLHRVLLSCRAPASGRNPAG